VLAAGTHQADTVYLGFGDVSFAHDGLGGQFAFESHEDLVQGLVFHLEFAFVGLADPQAGGGWFGDDGCGDVEVAGDVVDLCFVEVADGLDVDAAVAVFGVVTDEHF